jgi:hypothetical protein
MKHKFIFRSVLPLFLFLALASAASASSTWYVDGVNGSDSNDCLSSQTACKTIGHAIALCSSSDTIKVAPAIYTENLTIGISLKIIGSDAKTTIIDGGGVNTVVTIPNANAHVRLSKLTIRNGRAVDGGGVLNSGTLTINNSTLSGNQTYNDTMQVESHGGGIYNGGSLLINSSTLTGNATYNPFGNGRGGGIYNGGSLKINSSTLSGNVAAAYSFTGFGGGISNGGTLTINNSTLSGNSARTEFGYAQGGGISNGGMLTINNSTLSGNSSSTNKLRKNPNAYGGGIDNSGTLKIGNSTLSGNSSYTGVGEGHGGGIYNLSGYTAALQNSIVTNSPSGGNCDGSMTSNGYNLSSDYTCNFNNTGDLNNTSPLLGRLKDNGGPTQTIRLLKGSPAIDAGNPNGCNDERGKLLKTDQRGWARPGKYDTGSCDIGAFERQHD